MCAKQSILIIQLINIIASRIATITVDWLQLRTSELSACNMCKFLISIYLISIILNKYVL